MMAKQATFNPPLIVLVDDEPAMLLAVNDHDGLIIKTAHHDIMGGHPYWWPLDRVTLPKPEASNRESIVL